MDPANTFFAIVANRALVLPGEKYVIPCVFTGHTAYLEPVHIASVTYVMTADELRFFLRKCHDSHILLDNNQHGGQRFTLALYDRSADSVNGKPMFHFVRSYRKSYMIDMNSYDKAEEKVGG